jgi:hypothetical protein
MLGVQKRARIQAPAGKVATVRASAVSRDAECSGATKNRVTVVFQEKKEKAQ